MAITIDKEISTLEALKKGQFTGTREEAREAEELGMEALKRLKDTRGAIDIWFVSLLPGETTE